MKPTSTKALLASVALLGVFSTTQVLAQKDTTDLNPGGNNLVKVSVTAPFVNNYSLQYERAIGRKISAAVTVHFMPKSNLPFKEDIKDLIDNDDTWENVKNLKTGNFSIAPEVRFYFGKGVFRGFYLAPFVKYATYSAAMPYTFDVSVDIPTTPVTTITRKETIDLDGNISTYTGGLQIGAQWKLSKLVYLDWWIIGPNYGTSKGHIDGKKTLNSDEQQALREQLKDLDDLPLVKTSYTVDGNGAKVDFDGPWAGLRGGINIGFRF